MTNQCDTVAVVDDDDDLRAALVESLELDGLRSIGFASGEAALSGIDADFPGVVLTDLRMPGLDGTALFARLVALDPDLPVLFITGHGDLPTAVDLMRRGGYDFISKPFSADRLLPTIRRALDKRSLVLENRALRAAASDAGELGWVGASEGAGRLRANFRQIADAERPVLLLGETGTGKSLAAGLLHRLSRRARQPLVSIDCGALPAEDAASFLFGHASGALPGASLPRTGALRRAQRGTLVLERIDRLPAGLVAPLTRMLDTGSVSPLGSDIPMPFEAAVVATADPGLPALVEAGGFDRALYHRLAGFTVVLPPLRERRADIPALFGAFLQDAAERAGLPVPPVLAPVVIRLRTHDWPGNAHELSAFADEVALGLVQPEPDATTGPADLRSAVARYEAECLRTALSDAQGDIETARVRLGLPRKTLYDKLTRHAIVPADFRPH